MTRSLSALVLGFLLVGACGAPKAVCDSKSCGGCCDSSGACQVGAEKAACGSGGSSCITCVIDQVCRSGSCQLSLGGGGSDGGDGGSDAAADGGGDAGSEPFVDAGARDAGSATREDAGVTDGGSGEVVDAGTCTSKNCGGCCSGSTCLLGQSSEACGSQGSACIACGGGLQCSSSGSCQAPSCSASNCPDGCCSGTACLSPSSFACGLNGSMCIGCNAGQVCDRGSCVSPTCGVSSCPGCCQNNTCVSPVEPKACGFSGNQCTQCAEGQSCGNGTCGSTGNRYAGSPCAVKADCQVGGVLGGCNTGSEWPGGYCQDTCFVLGCHVPDVCSDNKCYERCGAPRGGQSTCRGGYLCDATDAGVGVCVPDCYHRACATGLCNSQGYCQ